MTIGSLGLVSHHLAIGHNMRTGAQIYGSLTSDARRKQSFGTDNLNLACVTEHRNRQRFFVEEQLRRLQQ